MLGPFATASRRIAIYQVSLLSHAACASMSTTTTTTTTTRDREDRYGPIEWAQKWLTNDQDAVWMVVWNLGGPTEPVACHRVAGSNVWSHAMSVPHYKAYGEAAIVANCYYRLLRQMAAQKKYNYIHKIQKYIHKAEHKNRLQAKITVHTLLKIFHLLRFTNYILRSSRWPTRNELGTHHHLHVFVVGTVDEERIVDCH